MTTEKPMWLACPLGQHCRKCNADDKGARGYCRWSVYYIGAQLFDDPTLVDLPPAMAKALAKQNARAYAGNEWPRYPDDWPEPREGLTITYSHID